MNICIFTYMRVCVTRHQFATVNLCIYVYTNIQYIYIYMYTSINKYIFIYTCVCA